MEKGAYALIFFFWAFLTIITPTLIQLSASAAEDSQFKKGTTTGIQREGLTIARKVMRLTKDIEVQGTRKTPSPPLVTTSWSPAPAPKERRKEEDEVQVVVLLAHHLVSKSRRLFLRGL